MVLSHKFYNGILPSKQVELTDEKLITARKNCFEDINQSLQKMQQNLDEIKLREALSEWINVARAGNKYLAETEPWKLVKNNEESTKVIMLDAIQICAKLAISAEVFLPHTAKKLKTMLGKNELQWNEIFDEIILSANHTLDHRLPIERKAEA